jgi:hypothetical protein
MCWGVGSAVASFEQTRCGQDRCQRRESPPHGNTSPRHKRLLEQAATTRFAATKPSDSRSGS